MNRRVLFFLRRRGHGATDYSGAVGGPEAPYVTLDVCEGGSVEVVARQGEPVGPPSPFPLACPGGTLQSQLVANGVPGPSERFRIQAVDAETGRGIPMVGVRWSGGTEFTDSNGVLAFHDPGLMLSGARVCADPALSPIDLEYATPGYRTRRLATPVCAGGETVVALERADVAERLYRMTGGGIYRDSVMLGLDDPADPTDGVPLREPLVNSLVAGQDSVSAALYRGQVHWTFADTSSFATLMGNLRGTGATSELPGAGGLDPELGVDLGYQAGSDGFVTPIVASGPAGLAWPVGLSVVDDGATDSLFAALSFPEAGESALGRFDGTSFAVEQITTDATLATGAPTYRVTHSDGDYLYGSSPVRHRATADALLDVEAYEAFTPLCIPAGGGACGGDGVERNAAGVPVYRWRVGGVLPTPADVTTGRLAPEHVLFRSPVDSHSGRRDLFADLQTRSYAAYRERYLSLGPSVEATPEGPRIDLHLGEGDTPLGPFVYARKVITVPQTLYLISHLAVFDKPDGRIYYAGTHSNSFNLGFYAPPTIPRYDYNQLVYGLSLSDPRTFVPVPVYDLARGAPPGEFATKAGLRTDSVDSAARFFAFDRPVESSLPVGWTGTACAGRRLHAGPGAVAPIFHVLPDADADGDGAPDVQDNCSAIANEPAQRDGDADGFGDRCDPDYDGDGVVGVPDFQQFVAQFVLPPGHPDFDLRFDHDGNGLVTAHDFTIFVSFFGGSPGPSGLACRGEPQCLPNRDDLLALREFADAAGTYAYAAGAPPVGFASTGETLGLVWRNPLEVVLPTSQYLARLVADAGADAVVAATNGCGTVALDASRSSFSDGSIEESDLTWSFGSGACGPDVATGSRPEISLPPGLHVVTLDVETGGRSARDTAVVEVIADAALADPDCDLAVAADDNCSARANPTQRDSNLDGYGDACDADYDGSGGVDVADVTFLLERIGLATGDPGFDPAADHDESGVIDDPDVYLLLTTYGQPPGPSGLPCAGTVPCNP
jgi:hypothetical protein